MPNSFSLQAPHPGLGSLGPPGLDLLHDWLCLQQEFPGHVVDVPADQIGGVDYLAAVFRRQIGAEHGSQAVHCVGVGAPHYVVVVLLHRADEGFGLASEAVLFLVGLPDHLAVLDEAIGVILKEVLVADDEHV